MISELQSQGVSFSRIKMVFFDNKNFSSYQLIWLKIEEFITAYDPQKPFSDIEKSISKTRALASHLISALELSALSNSEQAAAIMETVRHVGRATASSADIAKSEAILVCLTSLPSHYDRPDWFLDSLAKWLANRLGKKLVRELGKRLADY